MGVRTSRPAGAQTVWLPVLVDTDASLGLQSWVLPPAPAIRILGYPFVFISSFEHHFWQVWRSFRPLLSQAGLLGGLLKDPLTDDVITTCRRSMEYWYWYLRIGYALKTQQLLLGMECSRWYYKYKYARTYRWFFTAVSQQGAVDVSNPGLLLLKHMSLHLLTSPADSLWARRKE